MPLDPNTLYPQGYTEPAPVEPTPTPDTEEHGRDKAWCRNVLDVAVPADGDALTIPQLIELFCGTPDGYARDLPEMTVLPNYQVAIAQVRLPRPQRTHRLVGPQRTSGLTHAEVRAIVQAEIEERRPTWTEYEEPE